MLRSVRRRATALLATCLVVVVAPLSSFSETAPRHAARPDVIAAGAQALASYFEQNIGQADGRVRFVARGSKSALLLNATEIVHAVDRAGTTVRQRFVGTAGPAAVEGDRRLPGTSNYFIGSDRSRWRKGVPHFERVRYRRLYPGTDLVAYFADGRFEYDFVLEPGADPSVIRLAFDGASGVDVDQSGDLVVRTTVGEIRHGAPRCYQTAANGSRRAVAARFVRTKTGDVVFDVGDFDRTQPLVIDPIVEYSTVIGDGEAHAVAVDGDGNTYLAGETFVLGTLSAEGSVLVPDDAFVAKLDPTGTTLLYTTFFGGSSYDGVTSIAVDAGRNVFVGGYTESPDLPTVGAFQATYAGARDVFVLELDSTGSGPVFSTYLGGAALDVIEGIAVTSAGEACVTGWTRSTDFPTATPIQMNPDPGFEHVFVTKFAAGGATLVFSTYLGGTDDPDRGNAVAVDAAGNVYIAGYASPGFPTTPGAYSETGGYDAFITKIAAAGTALVYSTHVRGLGQHAGTTWAKGIAVDSSGNTYVTGWTNADEFPAINAVQPNPGAAIPDTDGFVVKLNATGSALDYSTYLGGYEYDEGVAIAVAPDGRAVVVGCTYADSFPTREPLYGGAIVGETDMFVSCLSPVGSSFVYSTRIPHAFARAVAVDGAGNAFVAGYEGGAPFPVFTTLRMGRPDDAPLPGFLLKLTPATALDTAGVYRPDTGAWFLKNTNAGGGADLVFTYGAAGAGLVPLKGDWDGDGHDTVGLYDPATSAFFLKNTNAPGAADIVFGYGAPGAAYVPLVGDWNGDGVDTVGLYDVASGFFFLRNANAPGPADLVFGFGPGGVGWAPVVGDWNDDAIDTVGLYNSDTGGVFLTNRNIPGPADVVFSYGPAGAGWTPLAGDWNGDGADSIGLYDPASGFFFLRNENAPGPADLVFGYGPLASTPLVGDWDGH